MLRYHYVLLFLCILSNLLFLSDNSALISDRTLKGIDMLNNVLVNILQKCDLGLNSTLIEDNSENLSTTIALIAAEFPITFLLQKNKLFDDKNYVKNFISLDGLIIVLSTVGDIKMNLLIAVNRILQTWSFIKNCTVIILPNPQVECFGINEIFHFMKSIYFPKTYLLCVAHRVPFIFTSDNYGDNKPSHWQLSFEMVSPANEIVSTIYNRQFIKDKICRGFDFERTNPRKNKYFSLGMIEYFTKRQLIAQKKVYYKGRLKDIPSSYIADKVKNLQKLLNMKFIYFVVPVPYTTIPNRHIIEMLKVGVDVYLVEVILSEFMKTMVISPPIWYDSCSILSHDRGLSSPLEKIADFYGIWTLISLITIMIITFVVIWLKTQKISAAAFDIVRLLVNTEILVPINTLALKIFFLMILLYFLVIHSTFGGNLTKFLTIPASLDNINTLEDLKSTKIDKIYVLACNIPELKNDRQLASKTIQVDHTDKCIKNVEDDPNSVCVSSTITFMWKVLLNDSSTKFHISKHTYPGMTHIICYRHRFILDDLFNWGIMVLSETKTLNYLREKAHRNTTLRFQKYKSASEIDFRPIFLKDLNFAFIFWSIGITLSIFCFLTEICVYQKNNIRKKISNIKIFNNRKKIPKLKTIRISVQPKS